MRLPSSCSYYEFTNQDQVKLSLHHFYTQRKYRQTRFINHVEKRLSKLESLSEIDNVNFLAFFVNMVGALLG